MESLEGQTALVTGGNAGIGLATAAALVEAGCRVTISGRNRETLEARSKELGCDWLVGDVSVEAEAVRAVDTVIERQGQLDILVNNAGFGRFAPLVDMETEDFEAVFRTNVFGAFYTARQAARHMVPRKSGAIVNVASTAALRGGANGTAYHASKFALRGMNEAWRDELRRHDVKVILVNPSEVVTDFSRRAGRTQQVSDKKLRPGDIAQAIIAALSMSPRALIPEFAVFANNPF